MRVVINAAVLAVTALILPNIYFVEVTFWNIVLIAVALGVLNAVVKPIIQFLTLSFIFATYGLVVVFINAIILWLLSVLFPDRFVVDSLLAALIGGALIGILGSFFESLLGLSQPITPNQSDEFRQSPVDQAPIVTKMILGADHEEEPTFADPAAPIEVSQNDSVSEQAAGLNPAEEREVDKGERAMEADTMPVDEDLENADTLEQGEEQAASSSDGDPPRTSVLPEVDESGLNPAEEREVEEGRRDMEEETVPVDEDLEDADTMEKAAETSNDDPNETPAQKQENESWQ